ncbi:hypothetical protein [Viridibacillus arvi]|uniref:hypothetical protein n=1 Tax=Viridibacillus arvi TaxID=263475 RepID=UPI0034CDB611
MFEKYPRANQLIEELNYHEHLQNTHWIRIGREEAAISLAKAVLTQKSLLSPVIHLRKAANHQVEIDYLTLDNKLHVFAKEEARAELGLNNEDVTKLFANIEIGGNRYL